MSNESHREAYVRAFKNCSNVWAPIAIAAIAVISALGSLFKKDGLTNAGELVLGAMLFLGYSCLWAFLIYLPRHKLKDSPAFEHGK